MLPLNILLTRHGESVGNLALAASKRGDLSHFTDSFISIPDTEWSLSETGQAQAKAIGEWYNYALNSKEGCLNLPGPRLYYVSPLRRTRETGGYANILDRGKSPEWRLNRSIRERDYGDIGSTPRSEFLKDPIYAYSARQFKRNPLYWRPPGGESIVDVAENRVRNFFDTLHRESMTTSVVITHGEFIQACHLTLTRANDEAFNKWERESYFKIANCETFHYSRIDCNSGVEKPYICSFRRIKPVLVEGEWEINATPWKEIYFHTYSNQELIEM